METEKTRYTIRLNTKLESFINEQAKKYKITSTEVIKNILDEYRILYEDKEQKNQESRELEAFIGETNTSDESFKETNVTTTKDAVDKITLKKGEIIVNKKVIDQNFNNPQKKHDETATFYEQAVQDCNKILVCDSDAAFIKTANHLAKKEHEALLLNLQNPNYSNKYNPLEYLDTDLDVIDFVSVLINFLNQKYTTEYDRDVIINLNKVIRKPYVCTDELEDSEKLLLSALISYLINNNDIHKEYKNLSNVVKLLNAAEFKEGYPGFQSPLDRLFEIVEEKNPSSFAFAAKEYNAFKKLSVGKKSETVVKLINKLSVFSLKEVANMTNEDEMSLNSLGKEDTKKSIFVVQGCKSLNILIDLLVYQTNKIMKRSHDDVYLEINYQSEYERDSYNGSWLKIFNQHQTIEKEDDDFNIEDLKIENNLQFSQDIRDLLTSVKIVQVQSK